MARARPTTARTHTPPGRLRPGAPGGRGAGSLCPPLANQNLGELVELPGHGLVVLALLPSQRVELRRQPSVPERSLLLHLGRHVLRLGNLYLPGVNHVLSERAPP